jgi:hypothetical protein
VRRLVLALLLAAALSGLAATAASASTWCGSVSTADRLPQVVPGPSIHLVYAYPSDGADRLASFATTMQTDVETIDAWWRGQDATRTPRFDTFAFSCGAQLDITDVKLLNTGAELTPIAGRFQKILAGVSASGIVSPWEDYLIYYDGPDSGDNICGQGGTSDPTRGDGVAIVYANACSPEPTAVVAAHELTHSLGAVVAPAPHDCPPPDDGHVCDSQHDLMYPAADGTPLSGLTLDVGHDDYYGASNIGFDVRTSRWLRQLDAPASHLVLGLAGGGTVASDVPGVQCTATCESDWDGGQSVTLTATPAEGMRFVRWSGACSGNADCTLALAGPTSVNALFAPQNYVLTVAVAGQGSVFSSYGAVCQKRCRAPVRSYATVTLSAVARSGWRFRRWGGACHGTRPKCTLPMSSNEGATAVFVQKARPTK